MAYLKHGYAKKKYERFTEYNSWFGMLQRCKPDGREYDIRNYSGRGITVCERWRKFENFLEDMGPKPDPTYYLDRKDNDGNYEPGNCRWATPEEQNNNRRTNRFVEFDGERLTITQWARRVGMSAEGLTYRIDSGWPLDEALTAPSGSVNSWKRRRENGNG